MNSQNAHPISKAKKRFSAFGRATSLGLLAALGIVICAPYAQAITLDKQKELLDKEQKVKEQSYIKNVIPRQMLAVQILRRDREGDGRFALRLMPPLQLQGCVKPANIPMAKVEKESGTMKIEFVDPEYKLDQMAVYRGHCDRTSNQIHIDIPMSRDELQKQGISKIDLKSQRYGKFADADILFKSKNHMVLIIQPSFSDAKGAQDECKDDSNQKDCLAKKADIPAHLVDYWFYPANTVVLYTPAAPGGEEVENAVEKFAETMGLTPLDDLMPDDENMTYYEEASTSKHIYYFLDPAGLVTRQLDAQMKKPVEAKAGAKKSDSEKPEEKMQVMKDPIYKPIGDKSVDMMADESAPPMNPTLKLGTAAIPVEMYGPHGKETIQKPMEIYARYPEELE